ncbi:multicomponent Na+:H+ antiporter subunit E [Natronospira proteinivora]|uniref:Multicomponent Na+:H+ antiporter subunit E n=1 Tax=Natronospira proteinivora TaxID=1807133 RepID=A0ABT1G632_9GAMM|nr:Na+/H+ antiporter subunit E [Natronospira proteinivora]MCP1726754.1 multicomponent Na+:H+ antiporter subunit E [Natronospira proteinivora]
MSPIRLDRHAWTNKLLLAAVLTLLWFALSGGQGWWTALPAIILILFASHWLLPETLKPVSLTGLLSFSLYFIQRSILGGLDVAWRALHPKMPLDIRQHVHRFEVDGPARTIIIGSLSLMPGTLSVSQDGDQLTVHSISGDVAHECRRLEQRAQGVFLVQEQQP